MGKILILAGLFFKPVLTYVALSVLTEDINYLACQDMDTLIQIMETNYDNVCIFSVMSQLRADGIESSHSGEGFLLFSRSQHKGSPVTE